MLALTESATQAVQAIVAGQQLPDGAGVRVSAVAAPSADSVNPDPDLRLSVVEAPEPGDEVIEGAPVYIDPGTAQLVSDKVLDARISDDQVQFMLRDLEPPRAEDAPG
jgi:Fe-S cluster assembly iron-binding protein IscA